MYTIQRFEAKNPPWERAEWICISWFGWGGSYRPETKVAMLYQEEKGFWLRFRCREKNPRIRTTFYDGEVCHDSCVEAFINFCPENDQRYLNLEITAAGVYLLQFGEVYDRHSVEKEGERLLVYTLRREDEWEVTAFLPQELLRRLYDDASFSPGRLLRGNFYKCGEKPPQHYATWQPVKTEVPNFHRPDFFASLKMG